MIKFIRNYACVFLKDISSIIIGDLHIGYEEELKKIGINIAYLEKIKEDITSCREKTKAKNIILLGDIKHSIGIPKNKNEIKNLNEFFSFLGDTFFKVFIVKGNHDGLIEKIINAINKKNIKIYSSRGFSIKEYGFFHGNSYPEKKVLDSKIIFSSHIHPKLFLPKQKKFFEIRVYIIFNLKKEYGKRKKLIILPSFSSLLSGKEIERKYTTEEDNIIIREIVDIDSLQIFDIYGHKIF